jgi:uncharacterized protein (TIGR00269 family)
MEVSQMNLKDKKFIRDFELKVKETIQRYNLVYKKDKIAVACSAGKDSTTALYLLKKFGFNVFALHINLEMGDYSKKCFDALKKFCMQYSIRLHIISMRKEFGSNICFIRSGIQEKHKLSNCTICGVVKRWLLNKKARQLRATKLVTGHNLDDEAQTILVNYFKGNLALGINSGPITGIIKDKKFVTRIKPLYFSLESDIKRYSRLMDFPVVYERCPCAVGTYRIETRKFLNELESSRLKVKERIVNNFIEILPRLRKSFLNKSEKLRYCKLCSEPSRKNICNTCVLLLKLKE